MMFEKIYQEYLQYKNEENRKERYIGKESWYHASGAGFCSRKLYYESVLNAETTNPPNKRSMRIMALGTAIHNDIQDSLIYYNNIYNNTNNKDVSIDNIAKNNMLNFHTEGEIKLKEFNVRGFYDIVLQDYSDSKDSPYIRLYDIKTISQYGYRQKFPRDIFKADEPSRPHQLQLATYGLAVEQTFGNLDSMDLIYYNKDDSRMKKQNVPLDYLNKAKRYWRSINEEHAKGLPVIKLGTSPESAWMCDYCQYKKHCKPPNFKWEKR
jgi:CRISPR/Cas system-associated exonuclease Cas4 (RecB family)